MNDVSACIPSPKKEMITVLEKDDHTTVWINPSSLTTIHKCLRKSQLQLLQGYTTKGHKPALDFGTAIHAGLEAFYLSDRKTRIMNAEIAKQIDMLEFSENIMEPNGCLLAARAFVQAAGPLAGIDPMGRRSIRCGLWTLKHYFEKYVNDPFVVAVGKDGEPLVEKRVEYKIHESDRLTIYVHGTIDLVLKNIETGNLIVMDHKTTSQLGQEFYNRLSPNHQYTAYLLGAKKCLGVETDVFVVNGLEVKPIPKTSRGTPPKFIRQPTKRSPLAYKEFTESVVHAAMTYLECKMIGSFPIGGVDSCAMWGGCEFREVCDCPTHKMRQQVLNYGFNKDSYATRPEELA